MSAKRGSKAAPREATSYALGDLVLGKVRGYQPWPGMVVDPDNAPQVVKSERPKNAKTTTFYCVRFFPNNEYAWLVEKDMSRLKPHEIAAFLAEPGKKKPDLVEGYRVAQDPAAWIEEMDAKAKAAAEAEGSDDDQVDELESEGGSASAAKSKKRKRASEAGVSAKKSRKGGDSASAKISKKGAASAKGRNGRKSKAAVESEDEHGRSASGAEDAGPSARKDAKEPPAKKAKKDQDADGEDEGAAAGDAASTPENIRVKDWRHRLQKTFLGKVPPKDEDMPEIDALFRTVEQTEVGIEGLQYSKIGKVMRHIAALTPSKVPRDAEFKFRERAKSLVERWQGVLNAAKAPANGDKGTSTAGSPGKDDADAKAAKDTAAAIASATAGGGDVKTFEGESTADMLDAPGEKDVDAHGEADVDAPGEVEAEVRGVEDGTAKMDLNGTGAPQAHPPATSDATAVKAAGDVEMADA